MTTARDNPKKNLYPGEVRAGELAALANLMRSHYTDVRSGTPGSALPPSSFSPSRSSSSVLLMGDFNTDAGENQVFSGNVKLSASSDSNAAEGLSPEIEIDTGFVVEAGVGKFKWQSSATDRAGESNSGGTSSNTRDGVVLVDPFEAVHKRRSHAVDPRKFFAAGADDGKVGGGGGNGNGCASAKPTQDAGAGGGASVCTADAFAHATSHNAKRRMFIDHIWASTAAENAGGNLAVRGVSNTRLPWRTIPHEKEPSDHIPIGVLFEFLAEHSGKQAEMGVTRNVGVAAEEAGKQCAAPKAEGGGGAIRMPRL